ncbi:MAG: Pyridinium-3,5-biscarboxylic acid mononucleotide synthase [Phycisphaerae bacterium]|nr:Pyridinium-3,5-biscarboxylic acid mononucleotide synthase [Phycisphaerae bacterium]
MNIESLRHLLEQVRTGSTGIDEALASLRHLPFEDLGFAKVDHHRQLRCGFPEVIYGAGKSSEQVAVIFEKRAAGGGNVLVTRSSPEQYTAVRERFAAAQYHELARCITLQQQAAATSATHIAVVAAGTSDLPVAEEARITAEMMHQRVQTYFDVGVAGVHRLLAHVAQLQQASVVVAVAGMEGALASVVGGLVAVPVIAVPTSVGYGAHFQGLAPLLTMLNSCASNVAVVNIDNGFGAGYLAALINRQKTE